MLCAPAVAWEISAPPTMPRGTSRSGPGLTSFIGPPTLLPGMNLYLQWCLGGGLVVDLQRGVGDAEAILDEALERATPVMAIVSGPHHDMGRQRREARGHLPDVEVVHLHHSGLGGKGAADLLRVQARRRGLHEDP